MPDIKVRVRGVTMVARAMAATSKNIHNAARDGVHEAAEHLKERIVDKLGSYQSTGGTNNGPWAKLKPDTISHKRTGDTPLYESGDMAGSLYVVDGGAGRLSASVGSDSPYIVHHIYGAPRGHVPKRDPARVTATEEKERCTGIIMEHIRDAMGRSR